MAHLARALLAFFLCAFAALPAGAQGYPSRPVRIIVPFAAGGPADIYARFLGQRLQEALGQPFVVEDRPGGGSVIGTDAVAKSAPDGYTLLMMSNTHTVNESLISNKPFQLLRDFTPVSPVNYSDLVLVVHPSVPASTLAGTPKPIVERLNAEIRKIVDSPEVTAAWAKQGAAPMSMSIDEFAQYLLDDIAKWADIVKISGAKVD